MASFDYLRYLFEKRSELDKKIAKEWDEVNYYSLHMETINTYFSFYNKETKPYFDELTKVISSISDYISNMVKNTKKEDLPKKLVAIYAWLIDLCYGKLSQLTDEREHTHQLIEYLLEKRKQESTISEIETSIVSLWDEVNAYNRLIETIKVNYSVYNKDNKFYINSLVKDIKARKDYTYYIVMDSKKSNLPINLINVYKLLINYSIDYINILNQLKTEMQAC